MVKKALKIFGILIVILVIAVISIPLLFGGTIKDKIRYLANEHVNAKVDFADVDISLLRSFPKASVIIDELSIINFAPFEGDTLAYAKKISLDMSINELFKGAEEAISVQKFIIDEANIAIKTDSLGNSNFDIAKESGETKTTDNEEGGSFTFELDHYEINNSKLLYKDDVGKIALLMTNVNHSGDGSLSGENIILDTESSSEVSFSLDDTQYLNKNALKLDAELELDLENQRYAFKENKALVNQLPLEFEGFVQLFEKYTDVDLSFKTPTSDFKNFLAVIPEVYAKNLDGVQTTGDFSVNGVIKGKADDVYIPKMDIQIASHNASFKYPDLPKSVQNINIDTQIKNDTGLADDIYVNIGNLTFKIDQDTFAAKGSLRNVTTNMIVDMAVNGTLNLANLDKAYPLELEQQLNGILKANVNTKFDMLSLEKEQYQNVKSAGTISLDKFTYASPELPSEINIEKANVNFKPETITLDKMQVTTGKSDLAAQGTINNLMGFLFSKQDLKGTFDVTSEVFAVNDFMVAGNETAEEQTEEETSSDPLKIPSFIDATLNFDAKKVIYDNLELRNTKGSVKINDETAYLQNVTSNLFDGGLAFNGKVSTKSETPNFGMNLDLSKINIAKSFSSLELLQGLAPIAKALTGALTTQININGNLNNDLTPVLNSVKGNALAEILNAKVNTAQTPLLSNLDSQLNFLDLDKLDLKDIKTSLSFDDGKINVKPFDFDIEGIKITAGGSHSFDMNMDYNVSLDVPAKYLGNEVGGLLSKLSDQESKDMTVALPIGISGNFSNPKINLNTGTAVKQLTQQIIDKQKEKATGKIVNEGTKVLTDLLGGSKKDKDSTKTTTDKPEDKLKDAAKDILGGFLGKKKKKDTTGTKN
ncbi:AsmA family protein [Aquimarina sp. MMG015]|uniref:AsmA family protein n=1 Tax=unclassified Aquimarina TaxID=2627091 RepID=UPI000E4C81DC|nr:MULTISPECIES: AsmA family protein [unclassified Aquimarina]AXT57878.1 AsmA family protein [Aquimarina sp. AD1]MBQ4803178.1 AsmA family protein [Aquimarina sp. MMG015]RKN28045.1 AsmA family protein [Aquimarina sp. AD1]